MNEKENIITNVNNFRTQYAWHQEDENVYREMIQMQLDEQDNVPHHKKALFELVSIAVESGARHILDLGCGAADMSRWMGENVTYTGSDLPHIIDNVANVYAPNQNYIKCDVMKDNISFIADYDLVVTNALLDVLDMPTFALERIMFQNPKYFILHRQLVDFNEDKSNTVQTSKFSMLNTYGGHPPPSSVIHVWSLNWMIRTFGYKAIKGWQLDENDTGKKIKNMTYLFGLDDNMKWDGKGEHLDDNGNPYKDKDGKAMRKKDNGEMTYE